MHMSGAFQLHLYWRAIPFYGDSNIFVFVFFFFFSRLLPSTSSLRDNLFPFSLFIEFETVREWKKKGIIYDCYGCI